MSPDEKSAVIQKELAVASIYLSNLRNTSGWRLHTIALLAGDARKSIRKSMALIGYTGQWWRDLGLYLTTLLPLAVPINLALGATIFSSLATAINSALSVVEMESRVIQTTIEVPYLWIFTRRKVISETIQVPVVHPPDIWVTPTVTTLVLCGAILLTSWSLKYFWLYELQYQITRVQRLWDRTLQTTKEQNESSTA